MDDLFATKSAIISDELITASRIYVELDFFQHVGVGKLLTSRLSEKDYDRLCEYVLSEKFEKRYCDDVAATLGIDISGAELPPDIVLANSPMLSSLSNLLIYLEKAANEKKVSDPMDERPLRVVINASMLGEMNDAMTSETANVLSEIFHVPVTISYKPLEDYTDEEILRFDTFFINDLHTFNTKFLDKLNDLSFISKKIVANRNVHYDKLDEFISKDVEEQTQYILMHMNAACEFSYTEKAAYIEDLN